MNRLLKVKTSMDSTELSSKFNLCVLKTQFGKTFTAIRRIDIEIQQDDEFGRSMHIVFTMNTLLNNGQFAKRLDAIENTYGKGSVCVFASKYQGRYTHVSNRLELLGLCAQPSTCPRVVVMCSNFTRYEDGVEFLKTLETTSIGGVDRAFAYYDELHSYINDTVRLQIEDIHSLNIVHGIVALTATPKKIWKQTGFWSRLQLIELDDFNDANYVGYKDMVFNCVDDFFMSPYTRPGPFNFDELDRETIGFITHVLERYPEILNDNSRTFIPAHIRRSGHNSVKELVFKTKPNAVVVVINGFEKTLEYNDRLGKLKTLPLASNDEEVSQTISRLIATHGLKSRPLVVTGFLCVGMGQTLTHESLGSFTSAIFGHLDLTNDDISQLFGRITGRMKGWSTYVQTQVYCPTTIMHRCHVMEECSRNMAYEHNGDIVTQDDYLEPMNQLGEAGLATIENERVVKEKQPKVNVEDMNMHIPLVISISNEELVSIHKSDIETKRTKVLDKLEAATAAMLRAYTCKQVTRPKADPQYKKVVTDVVNAAQNNRRPGVFTKKEKETNVWQAVLDDRENRIIVSFYTGLKTNSTC